MWAVKLVLIFSLFGEIISPIVDEFLTLYAQYAFTNCESKGTMRLLKKTSLLVYSHKDANEYSYTGKIRCVIQIQALDDYFPRIFWRKPVFDLSDNYQNKDDFEKEGKTDCENAKTYLNVYDGSSVSAPIIYKYCGSYFPIPPVLDAPSEFVTLEFVTNGDNADGSTSTADWRFTLGNYRPAGNCTDDDFRCMDMSCIPKVLLCDKLNIAHCTDASDTTDKYRSFCLADPPRDLFDNLWILYITLVYFAVLAPFLFWVSFVRPGYIWWLVGCMRRWRCMAIFYTGCPCIMTGCSNPNVLMGNSSVTHAYEEIIEYEFEEEVDGMDHSSFVNTLRYSKNKSGGKNTGVVMHDIDDAEMNKSNNGGRNTKIINNGTYGKSDNTSSGDGNTNVKINVEKKTLDLIPPNTALFEDWGMHVRENRF